MTPSILFLTVRMAPGFGISVVIQEVCRRLLQRGFSVHVGCEEFAHSEADTVRPQILKPDRSDIEAFCKENGITHVIAHSSPYFELLPQLSHVSTWAWEHGDPDPEFFVSSRAERATQIQRKRSSVYPNVDGVIAISEFVRSQIEWTAARVIRNGWEHVDTDGSPTAKAALSGDAITESPPLKVGCLMRLGAGEARYKGGEHLIKLAQRCPSIRFELMGRGSAADQKPYENAGIKVFRNATDNERASFLTAIDVFVTPSLWEGCNLPLMEAQAKGKASLAFDCGAHPEHSALICSSIDEMRDLLIFWDKDRVALGKASAHSRQWVTRTFSWDITTDLFLECILNG